MWPLSARNVGFVSKYDLGNDPAIVTIAAIVRGADTDRLTSQSAGLRDLTPDDHQVLNHGFIIYDALYAWASRRKSETHSWPPNIEACRSVISRTIFHAADRAVRAMGQLRTP